MPQHVRVGRCLTLILGVLGYLQRRGVFRVGAPVRNRRYEYLIQEFRCAVLRARLEANDLEAIGLALKAGLVTAQQALELAAGCGCLHWIAPPNSVQGATA